MEVPASMLRAERTEGGAPNAAVPNPQHRLPVDPGFTVEAEVTQRFVKGEDVAFCFRADPGLLGRAMASTQPDDPADWKLNYDAFVVCDGHSGVAANEFVRRNFLPTLQQQMPRALPPSFRGAAGSEYAAAVRTAIARTFDTLNTEFCARGELAGCTMTAVLITGGLLTVANVGDSDALLDAFSEHIPMSIPHRVNDNEDEQRRLESLGAQIAPLSAQIDGPAPPGAGGLGPLRVWPGGLCVSRSVGDIDVGETIICLPHVRQVLVPEWGCRMIVGSDGVWDCISKRAVLSACRNKPCGTASNAVIQRCLRVKQGQLVDDTTCCIVDCRPYHVTTFKGYQPDKQGPEALTINGGHTAPALIREGSAYSNGVASAPMDRQLTHGMSAPGDLTSYVPNTVKEGQPLAATKGNSASNGAATVQNGSAAGGRKKSGGLFACCTAPPATLDDDTLGAGATDTASERPSSAQAGTAAHESSASGGDEVTVHKSSSIAKGLSKLGLTRQKQSRLPPLSLYADVDTWVDSPATLNTVSESETDTTQGKSSEGHQHLVRANSGLDMGFEPPTQHTGQRSGVRWHTSAPMDSDHTTRPHHSMATALTQPQ